MAWYLAPSLAVLRQEINARWPKRDRTSDGTIGDTAHQSRRSDHNPNVRGSVNAIDIDADGVHMPTILAAVERHPSAHYWIWQRRIADRDDGWRPRTYTGSNPHTRHAHISIRQSASAEQDRRPWGLLPEVDMSFEQSDRNMTIATTWRAWGLLTGAPSVRYTVKGQERVEPNALAAALERIEREQAAARLREEAILARLDGLDDAAVLERVDTHAAALTAQAQRDAAALRDAVTEAGAGLTELLHGQSLEEAAQLLRELYADRPEDLARLAALLTGQTS